MKLFSSIAAAVVIGGSFIAVTPAEARNGWMKDGCTTDGRCNYSKVISSNWPYIRYKLNGSSGNMFTKEADCQQWRTRYVNPDGSKTSWDDVMPGSLGEGTIKNVCR